MLRGTSGQKQLEVSDVLFDAGFSSKEEAESFGVRPGDSIVPQTETIKTANGKNIISKSWDNRYGCTLVLDALETLQNEELGHTLIAGANVQEEVGLRGSKPSVHKFNPDIFFAVDCSAADDIHTKKGTYGHLGEGTLLRIFDPGLITLPRLREYLLDTAATHNIPYQYFVSKGGTDAGQRTQLITVYQVQSSAFVVVTSIRIKQCLVLRIMKQRGKCCYKHYVAWINQQLIQLFTESRGCLNDLSQFIRRTSNLC